MSTKVVGKHLDLVCFNIEIGMFLLNRDEFASNMKAYFWELNTSQFKSRHGDVK